MKVYIVMDSQSESGGESIKGVFANELDAKIALANYVLENEVDTSFLAIVIRKVEELEETKWAIN